ncbi:hypothetical protein [Flavobacterium sp. C4GT6]|uniref:hypothetical protein n=1 Tax=Flavobacterium sp. C4GT6 TaxID=3103818 RepID=UPI002ED27A75
MKLKKLYSLRKDFTIIGLTGRVGAGCSEIAQKLSDNNFIKNFSPSEFNNSSAAEDLKLNICYNYLNSNNNWRPFTIINYKNVLLFHLIHESNKEKNYSQKFIDIVCQNGRSEENKSEWKNRFDKTEDSKFIDNLKKFLDSKSQIFEDVKEKFPANKTLNQCLTEENDKSKISDFFFGKDYNTFSKKLYDLLNNHNITKRTRLVHDLANNLRLYGTVSNLDEKEKESLEHIYIIAETINRIIKAWRKKKENPNCKIVIDALKNSLEIMFFKEKYSAFYMIATNRENEARKQYVKKQITEKYSEKASNDHSDEILILDNYEYKSNDYKEGKFTVPDIENCIQKSDYHLFINENDHLKNQYLSINLQLIKLIALINQPGIITPTSIERTMQVAYNAKFNSGCISRQVGAVITDENFSVKSIGWNDVPEGQTPCNLRNIEDLIDGKKKQDLFSDFEKTTLSCDFYKDKESFKDKVQKEYKKSNMNDLEGRNCSFCFKTFHNAFEGEKNQVHTRSLHAEENAMLQITKYGGLGLKGGNLFTTASPCELCSKKAYQLGITNIYYIDPYPGIATIHTLKNGHNINTNPKLIMFQGAVGRVFHKLYEPFMAYKDEISILTNLSPKPSVESKLRDLIKNKELQERVLKKINGLPDEDKEAFLKKQIESMAN